MNYFKDLHTRARLYAKYQMDKRYEMRDRGEKVGGITGMIARAFFHGFIAGKKQLTDELKGKGIDVPEEETK